MKASEIDPCFFKGDLKKPKARNVGQLIKQLERLPKTLSVSPAFYSSGVELTVYNISQDNGRHLKIDEVEK